MISDDSSISTSLIIPNGGQGLHEESLETRLGDPVLMNDKVDYFMCICESITWHNHALIITETLGPLFVHPKYCHRVLSSY